MNLDWAVCAPAGADQTMSSDTVDRMRQVLMS
jgi:hypothetical protein